MCTESQLHLIQQAICKAAREQFGDSLDCVVMYGSYARGDCEEGSDIDFMVRVKLPKAELIQYRRSFSRIASVLGLENNIMVSIHLQDSETFEHYREAHAFYRNVASEGVVLSA